MNNNEDKQQCVQQCTRDEGLRIYRKRDEDAANNVRSFILDHCNGDDTTVTIITEEQLNTELKGCDTKL